MRRVFLLMDQDAFSKLDRFDPGVASAAILEEGSVNATGWAGFPPRTVRYLGTRSHITPGDENVLKVRFDLADSGEAFDERWPAADFADLFGPSPELFDERPTR